MTQYLSIIKNAPIFAGIDNAELEHVLKSLKTKTETFYKGEYILRAGQQTELIGLLLDGSALVIQEDFWGNRNLMTRITPRQIFAESFACSPEAVLNVSVTAEKDSAVMWFNINQMLYTGDYTSNYHTPLIKNLISELAAKNLHFNEKLTHMGQRTTREKLLSYLSFEAQKQNASEFDIPLNRRELADYLSVDRSAMSAELCKLRDSGILSFNMNHFVLLTPQKPHRAHL